MLEARVPFVWKPVTHHTLLTIGNISAQSRYHLVYFCIRSRVRCIFQSLRTTKMCHSKMPTTCKKLATTITFSELLSTGINKSTILRKMGLETKGTARLKYKRRKLWAIELEKRLKSQNF